MKTKDLLLKRMLRAMMLILMMSCAGWMKAQTFTVGNLNYSLNEDGASVTVIGHVNGQNATGELVIPENVELYGNTYPVTAIGNSAFSSCRHLTGSLIIPNSVTTIENYAFAWCTGLTGSLSLGNSVQNIKNEAFRGNRFTGTLTIPENVTSIINYAFVDCVGFTALDYNATNCNVAGWGLSATNTLTTLIIGENVQVIPDGFLNGANSIEGELVIPESVTSIGKNAFSGCSFTGSLVIPESVTSIGESAFNACSGFTGSLTIPDAVSSIGNNAFYGCSGLSDTLTIGQSVMQIGNAAFFGACQNFTYYNILPQIPPILGTNVFISANYDAPVQVPCGSLEDYQNDLGWSIFTDIHEPNLCLWEITATADPAEGGTIIGSGTYEQRQTCTLTATANTGYTFMHWTERGQVVSTNPTYSFMVTTDRELVAHFALPFTVSVTLQPTNGGTVVGAGTYNYGATCYLNAAAGSGYLFHNWTRDGIVVSTNSQYSFVVDSDVTLVANFLPSGNIVFADPVVKSICVEHWDTNNDGELSYVEALNVTSLGNFFRERNDISSFNELQYFRGLTSISEFAFNCCRNLMAITLPESITSIEDGAFQTCGALPSIILPEGLTIIKQYAFCNCTSLTTIILPESLTDIFYNGFDYCIALSSIQLLAVDPPLCRNGVFNNVNRNIPITVPCNTTAAYQNAAQWNEFTNYQEYNDCIYDVNVSFAPENAGTVTGAGQYQRGSTCTLTATPNPGRSFLCWTENNQAISTETSYSFTVLKDRNFGAVFSSLPTEIISFADAAVKAICVAHWDFDGDGELSYSEAAAVTSLGNYFHENTVITSFDELQFFTGLSTLEDGAFSGCTALNSMVLPVSLHRIGNNAFDGCTGLVGLLTLSPELTSIGNYAFRNCSGFIGGLNIPNTVTSIGNYAFQNCYGFMGLLTIGNAVVTLGDYCFDGCRNFTGSIDIPNSVVTIGEYAFRGCTAFWGTLTIGNSVKTIGKYAFYGCTGLVGDIEIPNSVTTIGAYAFYDCHSFGGALIIPSSVTSIGFSSFANCYGLSQINYNITNHANLPGDYWEYYPFRSCRGHLVIGNNVVRIPDNMFKNASILGRLTIPNSLNSIGNSAFENCNSLSGSFILPDNITSIGNNAFKDCTGFTGSLTLSNGMTTIPSGAFYNCQNFTGELVIPNSIISINDDAFYNCKNFSGTLVIPNSVLTIGVNAFKDCDRLSDVIMGINVMIVGNTSFYSCSGLQTVTLPQPVTVIGIEAFRYCSQLIEVNMQAPTAPSIGWDVFSDNAQGRLINIPCGATANYSEGYWAEWASALHEMCGDLVITTEVNPANAGTATGGGTYDYSDICTLVATSNIGYPFINWTKNNVVVSTESTYSFGVTESSTYVANFSQTQVSYDITVSVNMEAGGTATGTGSYLHGATVTLNAVSNDNYHFVSWTKNGVAVSAEANYSFPATETCTYVANFEPNNYNITAVVLPANAGFVSGTGVYPEGQTCTLTATPSTGYHFVNWTKGGEVVSTEATYSFTVTEPASFIANFALDVYLLAVGANPPEGGSVSTPSGAWHFGDPVTLIAVPNEGYIFVNWTKDGEIVSTEPTYSFYVTSPATYLANFELSNYSQTTALGAGWSWYSTYVEQSGINGLQQLENSLGNNGIIIKSRYDGYVEYYNIYGSSGWYGSLEALQNEQMYKIRTNAARNAVISGYVTHPSAHPITINSGWNWIGYPSAYAVDVAVALEGFTPEPDDIIKGRDGYTTYYADANDSTWFGTLNSFQPGQGYMYQSNSTAAKTLTFQIGRGEPATANIEPYGNRFSPREGGFADNMTITAVVELNGEELRSEDYELSAFVGDECRGSVRLMYVAPINRYVAFLTAFGESMETLEFRLADGLEFGHSLTELAFVPDGAAGTLTHPCTIRFVELVSIDESEALPVIVYPNPSTGIYHIEGNDIQKVEVYDALGQLILSKESGNNFMQINLGNRPGGMYVLRVVTREGVTSKQIIKQ